MRKTKQKASSCPDLKFAKSGAGIPAGEFSNWKQTEADLQLQCEELLAFYPNLKVLRVPDTVWAVLSGQDKWKFVVRKFMSTWFGGMPDLMIIKKGWEQEAHWGKYNVCLAVELKVKGRKLQQKQKQWAEILHVHKIEKLEDFAKLLERFANE